jgi:hypothetical protein
LWIPLKEGIGDERRPKDRAKTGLLTLQITLLCKRFEVFDVLGRPKMVSEGIATFW